MLDSEKTKEQLIAELRSARHRLSALNDIEALQRRLAETLRVSEERLRIIADNTYDWEYWRGPDGKYLWVSPSCETISGYSSEEFTGDAAARILHVIHPEDKHIWEEHIKDINSEHPGHHELDLRIVKATGETVWISHTCKPIYSEDGSFLGSRGSNRDITERKIAEQNLTNSNIFITHLLNSMPIAVVGIDDSGIISHFNRKALELFDKSYKDVAGLDMSDVLPLLPVSKEELDATRAGQKTIHLKQTILRSVLGIRLADMWLYPLKVSGQNHLVIIIEDVTERVRLEGMMVQTEKMMSLGGLAAGMAHEINNPLGGIMQAAQVMERRLHTDTPVNREAAAQAGFELPALWSYLEIRGLLPLLGGIRDSAKRAAVTVASMLEFSRKSDGDVAPADVAGLIDKAVTLCLSDYGMENRYDFRKIEIIRDYESSLPFVPCMANQIEQVLLNLLRNAAQAMRGLTDGSDQLRITLRTRLQGNMARIEVEDNGPGMDEATRKRIFEPFFTTKPPGIGTGLGLSVSYFIITSTHEGSIGVESSPGKGAKFIIKLPLHQNPVGS